MGGLGSKYDPPPKSLSKGLVCSAVLLGFQPPPPPPQGCIRREAVRQAVGGGCPSVWGRLLSVTSAVEAGTWRYGDSGGHRLGTLEGGGAG